MSEASTGPETIVALALGRRPYGPTWALQRAIQQRLIEAKRQAVPEPIPHVLLLVEHPHVYTLGKSGDERHLLLDAAGLERVGATFERIDRGGDVTYHGPGQLVAYPLLDLDRLFTDIHRYLRELEEVVIRTCADLGVAAGRVDGRTGVWVGPDARGPERKVCAMGIRCSRWVTMHGLALNVNADLGYFDHIVPCGIADRGVTSLQSERGAPVDEAHVRARLLAHVAERFGARIDVRAGAEAQAWLDGYLRVADAREP